MTHQNLHLGKCWKLFWATLISHSLSRDMALHVAPASSWHCTRVSPFSSKRQRATKNCLYVGAPPIQQIQCSTLTHLLRLIPLACSEYSAFVSTQTENGCVYHTSCKFCQCWALFLLCSWVPPQYMHPLDFQQEVFPSPFFSLSGFFCSGGFLGGSLST